MPIRPVQPDVFGPPIAIARGRQRAARPLGGPLDAPPELYQPAPAFVARLDAQLGHGAPVGAAVAAELWGHAVADVFRGGAWQAGRGVLPAADHVVHAAVMQRAEQLLEQRAHAQREPAAQMRAWREAPQQMLQDPFAQHPARYRAPVPGMRRLPYERPKDLNDYEPLRPDARLPEPYATVLQFDFASQQQAPSVHRQLRFFAALAGPAQSFSLTTERSAYQFSPVGHRDSTMLSFVRRRFHNPGKLFDMRLADGVGVQVHGENYPRGNNRFGAALKHYSEQFSAALQLALARSSTESQQQTLRRLLGNIQNWCFDGSVTRLNQFLQEEHLTGADLSLVPNFDHKHTLNDQGYECLRVFRLHAARKFEVAHQMTAQDERGSLRPAFIKRWFNEQTFARYLKDQDFFSQHARAEIRMLIRHLVDEAELLPRKWGTPTRPRTQARSP